MRSIGQYLLVITTAQDEVTGENRPLFFVPLELCPATGSDSEARFDVAAPSGAPRRLQYIDAATGEICADSECPRGVRVGDTFRPIAAEQIAAITKTLKSTTMTVIGQIALDDLPWERTCAMHYLQTPPKGGASTAYRLVYEALRAQTKGKRTIAPARALLVKYVPRSRQRLGVVWADEKRECLVLSDLRYANEVRKPDQQLLAPQQALISAKQLALAREVVGRLPDGTQALESELDEVLALRSKLIEQALSGEAIEVPTSTGAVLENLEAVLAASLQDASGD
jgi:non-homologous end joining protein Ku